MPSVPLEEDEQIGADLRSLLTEKRLRSIREEAATGGGAGLSLLGLRVSSAGLLISVPPTSQARAQAFQPRQGAPELPSRAASSCSRVSTSPHHHLLSIYLTYITVVYLQYTVNNEIQPVKHHRSKHGETLNAWNSLSNGFFRDGK